MKGLMKVAHGHGNMEIRELDEPKVGPDQVKIEIKGTGICGSDIHVYHEAIAIPMRLPVVTGHEMSGVIVEVGKEAEGIAVGDRVTTETTFSSCGKCLYCRTGYYQLCAERRALGYWFHGGFTKYTVVPAIRIHKLPENVDFLSGALTEPLACCVHGVTDLTGITSGDFVVVTGPGTLGLINLQLAKGEGATVAVLGTSVDGPRLALAKELGADYTINVEQEDALKMVRERTEGYGADVVLECSGATPAVELGMQILRKRGKYTQFGLFGKKVEMNIDVIAYKEIKATGVYAHKWTAWRKAIQYLGSGKVKTRPLVTDVMPITDWKKGFEKFEKKDGLKIVLTPVD
jgi:L-iditol 2-dehydrogenase